MFMGTMVPGLALAAFAKMDNQAMSNARTLYYCVRTLGVSFGVTLTDVLIDRRTTLHSARLLESAFRHGLPPHTSLVSLSETVRRQALVLSYQDVFFVMGVLAIITCFFLLLLPPATKRVPALNPAPANSLAPSGAK